MEAPNRQWMGFMAEAKQNLNSLLDEERIREITKIIRTNVFVAKATGHSFISQLALIHHDMLQLYKVYAGHISDTVRIQGPMAIRDRHVRAMRSTKIEILTLLRTFIERSEDPQLVATQVVETLYGPVLEDYSNSAPAARDAEVLELFAAVVGKLKGHMSSGIHRVLQNTFAPTLVMICGNFEDAPEHRQHFYSLLKQVNLHCFVALWSAAPEAQKQIVDAVIWGMKHTQSDVAQTSLEIMEQLLVNVDENPQIAQQFYHSHLLKITSEVLFCLTDRLHKSGFKMHASLLKRIFGLVQEGKVQVSLFDANSSSASPGAALVPASASDNVVGLSETVSRMILQAFPNVSQAVVHQFVQGLFNLRNADLNVFKQHVRDFLIQLKEFSAEDNKDLFKEESEAVTEANRRVLLAQRLAVPGLVNPNDDMADL
jgi:exportin-1